jgi:ferredoxin, 2Fe-2S
VTDAEVASVAPVVHVEPIGVDLALEPGETIIEAAWRLGYYWPTVCYGQARCTQCAVEVLGGEENLTPVEGDEGDALRQRLSAAGRRDLGRIRLACRARATGRVTVRKDGVCRASGT